MKTIKFLSIALVAVMLFSCNKNGVTNKPLKTEIDSVSYAIGLSTGTQIRTNFSDADVDIFIQGLRSGVDSTNILIEGDKVNSVIQQFFKKKQQADQEKQQAERLKKLEEQYNDNKVAGENFLEENKAKEGVKTTASGLQYIVLKEGNGEKPEASSKVKVHYHGTNINGEVFDSSVDRGTPSEFFVNQVIKGWTEGLQLMPVGSKYKFFIPQELSYGAFPRQGGKIKPFDALVFEVELIEIVK
ncbi:FKBP-type peptidyl-prolyl cis-trans isomerase [Jejuia spongiicola]|uniref:Peptidyl-prolyl cis-trans isomerase n=1 Tax=Jejuia spongiicola TaxID=2942207 RepID=A0ABT0QFJ3_9FLAO|nr:MULTISPECIES: FKBP-type peptidyl-prolyl cis-trans isomerase [Flavobacteriaceae]MCL6295747.1 FKBP-type peptidyl-prolyl cis-trans isomerase [Jejuia spongiicola]PIA81049.1 peptidylprolyl isomerase [Gaetbulibacter sp. 4G1]